MDNIPPRQYQDIFRETTSYMDFAIEVEHLVREHCAKIAELYPFSPQIGKEIAKLIREAGNG